MVIAVWRRVRTVARRLDEHILQYEHIERQKANKRVVFLDSVGEQTQGAINNTSTIRGHATVRTLTALTTTRLQHNKQRIQEEGILFSRIERESSMTDEKICCTTTAIVLGRGDATTKEIVRYQGDEVSKDSLCSLSLLSAVTRRVPVRPGGVPEPARCHQISDVQARAMYWRTKV